MPRSTRWRSGSGRSRATSPTASGSTATGSRESERATSSRPESPPHAEKGSPPMSDLTAIDTLINPDASMMARAKEVNQRVLQSVPSPPGFALDEHHQPHITVLQ